MALMLFAVAVIAFFASITSVLTGRFIDAISHRNDATALYSIEGIAALGVLFACAWALSDYLAARMSERAGNAMRQQIVRKLYRLPFEVFAGVQTGELENRINGDVGYLVSTMYTSVVQVSSAVLSIIFIAVAMVWLSWQLAAISLALIPVWLFIASKHRAPSRDAQIEHIRARDTLSSQIIEFLSVPGIIRCVSFFRRDNDARRFEETTDLLLARGLKLKAMLRSQFSILAVSITLTNVFTLLASLYLFAHGWISLGTIVSFIGFRTSLQYYVSNLASAELQMTSSRAMLENIETLLSREEYVAGSVPVVGGDIEVRNVSFTYSGGDRPALEGVSLKVRAGERMAIVGPSGSGKSTLALLMQGFYEPASGEISISGVRVADIEERSLRSIFSFTHSLDRMFPGTIRENAQYAKDDASDLEIWEAADRAGARALLRRIPDGLDSAIGNGSQSFSTGELQRLCLMRALLKKSQVMLLDEPTSALDAEVEADVLAAIRELPNTLILITHRLSSVLNMDRVCVMESGRIAEHGAPMMLLRTRGMFYRMLTAQVGKDLVDSLIERIEVA